MTKLWKIQTFAACNRSAFGKSAVSATCNTSCARRARRVMCAQSRIATEAHNV